MDNIVIRPAIESDLLAICNFLRSHFENSEPSICSHYRKDEKLEKNPPILELEALRTETLLLAHNGHELVGLVIATEKTNDKAGKSSSETATSSVKSKNDDVWDLVVFISELADHCNKLRVPACLQVQVINTHSDHLRKGIAKKLFKAIIEQAKSKDFPAITVDCTSFYTSKIAESFGMHCIAAIGYDEYNKIIGKTIFVPSEPHTEIRAYGMLLDNTN